MSPRKWFALDPEDDLIAMERSTMRAFIGPEQEYILRMLWANMTEHPLPIQRKIGQIRREDPDE